MGSPRLFVASLRRLLPLCVLVLRLAAARAAELQSAPSPGSDLARPLSLTQCLQLAEQSEPFTLSQRALRLDAEAAITQARALPNPSFSYVAQDIGLTGATGPLLLHQAMLGIAPFATLLRIQESRAACAAQGRSVATAQVERQQLREAVGRAYYELLLLHALHAIDQDAVALAGQLLSDAQARMRHGDASGLDLARAQAEVLDAQRQAGQSAHQRRVAQLAFSVLIGAPTPAAVTLLDEPIELTERLPAPLQERIERAVPTAIVDGTNRIQVAPSMEAAQAITATLVEWALASRPERAQAVAEQRHAQELQRLAQWRATSLADLQIAGGVRSAAPGVGGVLAVSGSLPLLDFGRASLQRAAAGRLRARAHDLDAQRQITLQVHTAWASWQHQRALRRGQALPLRDLRLRALTAVRRQFAEGVAPFADVVQAGRDVVAAQRALAQIERDARIARWQLAIAVGAW